MIDQAFQTLGPKFTEPRPIQRDLLEKLNEDQPDLAFLEAPTGIGKSAIALAYGELLETRLSAVLTATISLQEQYDRDFDDVLVFKGRGNFPCLENGLTAAEGVCLTSKGFRCGSPYYQMRRELKEARRVVANYAVWLNHLFYSGLERRPNLLVLDEAHRLVDILTDFEKIKLDAKLAYDLGFPVKGWGSLDEAQDWARRHEEPVSASAEDAVVYGDRRARKWLALRRQIAAIKDVPEDYITLKTGESVEAAPLWPRKAARRLVQSAGRVLMMSATLYGGHLLAELLGLAGHGASEFTLPAVYVAPSPFQSSRWPVYYRPVAPLSKRAGDEAWQAVAEKVHEYVHQYHNVKGVIHVASKVQVDRALSSTARCGQCRRRTLHPNSRTGGSRADILAGFRTSPNGTWLCHYSVGEGESFDDDAARIQIIAKVPYPDLGDKLTRLRSEEPGLGRKVYAAMTLNRIAQTAGRVMRHEKDYGETIILDGAFRRLWSWHKGLAPSWLGDLVQF